MGNPAVTDIVSAISVLLKTHFGDGVVEQYNSTPMAWKMFDKSPVEFGGNFYEFPIRVGMPQSIGPRDPNGGTTAQATLPTVLQTSDVTARVYHKYLYGTFELTGPDIERARTQRDAFVVSLQDRMNAITQSFFKDCNFQTYLPGTGIYAKVASNPGSSQLVLDTVKYLRVGRRIDVWDDSASNMLEAAATNNRVILAINPATKTITMNATLAAAAAPDGIVPETGVAAGASTGVGIFLNGLGAIVDDGTNITTFQGVSRSTYPAWKATVLGNSGTARALTLTLMQLLCDIPQAQSGKEIDLLIGSLNARNAYLQLVVNQKRFTDDKLDGGYASLDYNGKKFMVDVDCQDDTIYGLNKGSIKRFGMLAPKFDDTDGSVLKTLAFQDKFTGWFKMYGNLGTDQSNCHAKITDIPVNSSYLI